MPGSELFFFTMDVAQLFDHDSPKEPTQDALTENDLQQLSEYLEAKLQGEQELGAKLESERELSAKTIKYLHLRNMMLVDLLDQVSKDHKLANNDKEALKKLVLVDSPLEKLLQPLLGDSPDLLNNLPTEIKREINHLESSTVPDIYRDSDYEIVFERVKRNVYYNHEKVKSEMPDVSEESTPQPQRQP